MALTKVGGDIIKQPLDIVTATSFVGSVTGTATTATNLANAANITTGTISNDRLPATITKNLTGNVTGNASSATVATNAQGLTGSPSITVDDITATSGTFSGNVSIGGTLTYEDVTNIDSVGIVTARNIIFSGANGTAGQFVIRRDSDGANIGQFRSDSGTNDISIGNGGSGSLILKTGANTERLRITSAGLVGIGTDNPGDKLSIYTSPNSLVIGCKDSTRTNHVFQLLADDPAGNGELRLYKNSATGTHEKTVEIAASGNSYINSGSNFGIGTDVPSTVLHLLGADSYLTMQSNSASGNAGILFKDSSGTQNGVIFYDFDDDFLKFSTNNDTERLRITSDGKIGINETAPAADLVVKQSGNTFTTASQTVALFQRSSTTGHSAKIAIVGGNAASSDIHFGDTDDEDIGLIQYNHTDDSIRFETNSGERLRITSVGDLLLSGLTNKNDGRNAKGLTLKSTSAISFQNFGANGSRNWRIRPDDLSAWGSLDFCVSPTDNNDTDWPDAASDVVLELKKNKDVKIHDGNLIIGTSGHGIDFSATGNSSGTMSSELLDDYEEGTWSPIFSTNTAGASGQSYGTQRGRYTKIGRIVHCSFDVALSTKGTFGGTYVTLGGLPYSNLEAGNCGGSMTIGYYSGFNLPASCSTITSYNSTANVYIMTPRDNAGADYLTVGNSSSQMTNTSRLIGQITLYLTS